MNRKIFILILLILISFLPLNELLKSGMPQTHDFVEHAARLSTFYQSLREGNPIPRWGGNLNYTYGHPVLLFLYPLTNYLGSIIHLFGFSIVDSLKILFSASFIASGILMYLWVKRLWGEKAGFLSAVFYLFSSYRFVDIYVRAALGEHLAFAFIPLTLLMLGEYLESKKRKYLVFSSISLALLILSHNAVSLMFIPFICVYGLYLIFKENKKKRRRSILYFGSFLLLGLGLSAFFWLSVIVEGKYTLREIVTNREVFVNNFLKPRELVFSKWGYGLSSHKEQLSGFKVSLDWFQWLVLLGGIFILLFRKTKENFFLLFIVLYTLISLFLATNLSSGVVNFIPLIYRFQFPWRLLAIPVFTIAILAGYLIYRIEKRLRFWQVFVISLILVLSTAGYWKVQGTETGYSDDYLFSAYTGTTETGESTPRWALRFQEDYPDQKVQLVYGGLDGVEIEKWYMEEHRYKIKVREDSQIADNTLYFPGWKVWVDGREVPIKFHDLNWRGVITYPVPVGEHEIMVKFTRTRIRLLGDLLSITTFIAIIVILLYPRVKYVRKQK